MVIVNTPEAPLPLGHYAQAVVDRDSVYVSGQLPGGRVADAPGTQMRSVLQHCGAILRAAGSNLQNVTSLTIYVTDLDDWEEVDKAVADAFQSHRPSRTVLQVAAIRKGYRVQAALIARVHEHSGEEA